MKSSDLFGSKKRDRFNGPSFCCCFLSLHDYLDVGEIYIVEDDRRENHRGQGCPNEPGINGIPSLSPLDGVADGDKEANDDVETLEKDGCDAAPSTPSKEVHPQKGKNGHNDPPQNGADALECRRGEHQRTNELENGHGDETTRKLIFHGRPSLGQVH